MENTLASNTKQLLILKSHWMKKKYGWRFWRKVKLF